MFLWFCDFPTLSSKLLVLPQDRSSGVSCPSIPLKRSLLWIVMLTWSHGRKTNYSSHLPDFSKVSWLSLFKTTKKVKILLYPPGPAQLCSSTPSSCRQAEWLGHSTARQTRSKPHFSTVQHPEKLHSFTLHLSFLFLFIYFTILTPCAIPIVLCAVVTDAAPSEMFKSFWKGCQSLLEKSWEANTSGDPNVIKIISIIKKWLF